MVDDILYSSELYVLCFFLTGIILIVLGFLKHRREERFEKYGIKTTGVIHDLIDKGDNAYYPVIHFTTMDGERIYKDYEVLTFTAYMNQSIEVIYNQDNPSEFIVTTPIFSTVFGKQYIILGLIMMFLALIMFIWYSF